MQLAEEGAHEEGVGARLLEHDVQERVDPLRPADRVLDELRDGEPMEGRELDLGLRHARLGPARQGRPERVVVGDLVGAKGAEQQHVARARRGQEGAQQVEARHVDPLQVVEEDQQRRLGARGGLQEAREDELEAVLRLQGAQAGHRRLLAEQQAQLGEHVHEHLPAGGDGLPDPRTPRGDVRFGLRQQLPAEVAQRLEQGVVGDVAGVGLALADKEVPVALRQRSVHLPDQRGLADARPAGHERHLRRVRSDGGDEALEYLDLRRAAVELRRELEAVGDVLRAEVELVDHPGGLELVQAVVEVRDQAARALVAVLGVLLEQPGEDGRDGVGHRGLDLGRGARAPREVGVHPAGGVVGLERQLRRQQLEERDAQRVEVRAVADAAVHPPGLLGGDPGQPAGQRGRGEGVGVGLVETGAPIEADERDGPGVGLHEDRLGVGPAVDHAGVVHDRQRLGDGPGQAQAAHEVRPREVRERDQPRVVKRILRPVLGLLQGDLGAQGREQLGVVADGGRAAPEARARLDLPHEDGPPVSPLPDHARVHAVHNPIRRSVYAHQSPVPPMCPRYRRRDPLGTRSERPTGVGPRHRSADLPALTGAETLAASRSIDHAHRVRTPVLALCLLAPLSACEPQQPSAERPLRLLSAAEYNNTVRDLLGYGVVQDWPRDVQGGETSVEPWPWAFPDQPGVDDFEGHASGQVLSALAVEQWGEAAAHFAGFATGSPWFSTCGPWGDVPSADREDCAWASVERFASRAWRRPPSEDELDRLRSFHDANVDAWGPGGGATLSVQGILLAPQFLYLLEHGEPGLGDRVPLTSWEVASRLSYFLWDSMPDPELFAAAEADALGTAAEVEAQARRMLTGRRARQAVVHFHRQWLELDAVYRNNASADSYGPLYAAPLLESANEGIAQEAEQFWSGFLVGTRRAMDLEAQLFVEQAIFDRGGTLADLFTDTRGYSTEVGIFGRSAWDANTALIYGVDQDDVVDGPFFVFEYEDLILPYDLFLSPVQLPPDQRAGILTLGAVLAGRAHPVHPSPVLRGLFVLERLGCQPMGQPPPGAIGQAEPDVTDLPGTNRGRLEALTGQAPCSGCHDPINAAGFAFERYDSLGGWRDEDGGEPVDARGSFELGGQAVEFDGAVELAGQLAEHRAVQDCYVRNWVRYALGRREVDAERDTLIAMQDAFAASGGDIQELLVATASSDWFRHRFVGEP